VICRHCNVEMRRGIAIQNTFVTGIPDFGGAPRGTPIEKVSKDELRGQTIHIGGRGTMILCLKCPECGYSTGAIYGRNGQCSNRTVQAEG
jgi:hypothetical protein